MEMFAQWLLSITACTIVISIAETLMPHGAVKQVGKMICGLVLLIMIVKPVASFPFENLMSLEMPWEDYLLAENQEMEIYYNNQLKSIIEEEVGTYILDKAKEAGISSRAVVPNYVVVHCILGEEGIYLPHEIEIYGVAPSFQDFFIHLIEEDLALERGAILFKEEVDEKLEDSPNL